MEYPTTASTRVNKGVHGWVSPSYSTSNSALASPNLNLGGNGLSSGAPSASNWSAKVGVTNTLSSIGSGYTYSGFEFYTLNDADGFANTTISPSNNAYYGIYLSTIATSGNRIIFEWGKWNSGISDFDRVSTYSTATSTSGVVLRMDFNGTSKIMTGYFSFDSGASFTSAGTFNLASTQAGIAAIADNAMGLELLGLASSIGVAVTSGQIFFDNLSVTAIPEPMSYAAIFGAGAFGFAIWRRRWAKSSTAAQGPLSESGPLRGLGAK
ncbi:MAG: PEP-CTERM sorting domain-containing protein [Opitutus sp.]|nr:PEP-CTERM sorting domain-containing protein [Opitutus sp.]